jgi:hypothetical protein
MLKHKTEPDTVVRQVEEGEWGACGQARRELSQLIVTQVQPSQPSQLTQVLEKNPLMVVANKLKSLAKFCKYLFLLWQGTTFADPNDFCRDPDPTF